MRKIDLIIIQIALAWMMLIAWLFAMHADAEELATVDDVKTLIFFDDEIKITDEEIEKLTSLGEFRLTAYCGCEECCDGWSKNRPKDEHGNEIVFGATGQELIDGVSIAVDKNVIPYGTKVMIAGKEYMAHDCGGAIKGNRIDVYHSTHSSAKEFGVQYAEVFIKGD